MRPIYVSTLLPMIALISAACGDLNFEKKVIDKRTPPPSLPTKTDADTKLNDAKAQACELRNKAYQATVKDLVDNKCISCHVAGGTAESAFAFIPGDDNQNTQIFSRLMGGNSDALVRKLDGTDPHGGGKQVDSLVAKALNEFFTASAECN